MALITSSSDQPLIDASGPACDVVTSWGEASRTRIASQATGGRVAVLDYRAPPGFGPPRHLHRQDDELFLVGSGTLVVWTPTGCWTVGPGDVVFLPRRQAHTWRAFGPDAVQLHVTVAPGDFERFFPGIVAQGLRAKNLAELTAVADHAGMDILGPPLTDEEVAAIRSGKSLQAALCTSARAAGQ